QAQIVPMAEINLHFTGDFYAVERAHNLLAAMVDNHVHFGNEPWIDPRSIVWRRVMDMNDRALRNTMTGLGGRANGVPRETGFDITAASEVMSVLTLATGMADLRERLGRMVVGAGAEGVRITAASLQAVGAMTALLSDAARPNLVQTLEGTPALVHCGPFANISIGASSVVADRIAAGLSDFVVTESGFGADLGFEKFCNIKTRVSGMIPDCAVLVATVRAIKFHSGRYAGVPAAELSRRLSEPDLGALRAGAANLAHHVSIIRRFGVPAVVALNRFASDSEAEIELALQLAREAGAAEATVAEHHAEGGAGAEELAGAVERASATPPNFAPLYELETPLREKIQLVATQIYGAEGVAYDQNVARQLTALERQGFGALPVCMAKTPQSISHDPRLLGHPAGFILPINGVRLFAGAGFVTALCGDISLMPGLGRRPAAVDIDVDAAGNIVGF
ncbi:MAG: formate--tetrahydrofolate ligase, partial [Chloroflexota bacterium]